MRMRYCKAVLHGWCRAISDRKQLQLSACGSSILFCSINARLPLLMQASFIAVMEFIARHISTKLACYSEPPGINGVPLVSSPLLQSPDRHGRNLATIEIFPRSIPRNGRNLAAVGIWSRWKPGRLMFMNGRRPALHSTPQPSLQECATCSPGSILGSALLSFPP